MQNKPAIFKNIKLWLLCAIFASIVFARFNLNSFFIILYAATWLVEGQFHRKSKLLRKDLLFFSYAIYFLLELISMFYSPDFASGWKNTEGKVGLFVLPLLLCSDTIEIKSRKSIMLFFCVTLTIAALICISYAYWMYFSTKTTEYFFYHSLVSPFESHAVYFSVFTSIAFIFLVLEFNTHRWVKRNPLIYAAWLMFLFGFMVLLSSKLVLILMIIFTLYFFTVRFIKRQKKWQAVLLLTVAALFFTAVFTLNNPVKERFTNLVEGNFSVLEQKTFGPADYFNGFQFRLLLWRITYEVLDDKDAWLFGVSAPLGQPSLQEKYRELNLYSGDAARTNHGYFDYNCHNQFLQTTLQLGIVGLTGLVFLVFVLVKKSVARKEPVLLGIIFITICFFLTESVLERQYGIILLTAFPLLYLRSFKTEENR